MKALLNRKFHVALGCILLGAIFLTSCCPAMTSPVPTSPTTEAPRPTRPPAIEPTKTPLPPAELRVLELEWPSTLQLGDSDVIRLSLIPSEDGYTARAEYQEHTLSSQDVKVRRPEGFTLSAMARLDGAGFEISPEGEQWYVVQQNEAVTWRWSLSPRSPGKHRVSMALMLRWEPDAGVSGRTTDSLIFDRSLDIRVTSFLGLPRPAAFAFGFTGIAFSLLFGVWAWAGGRNPAGKRLAIVNPDQNLSIETAAGTSLNPGEIKLLQALFAKYRRLIVQHEFMSGYSGARTFLARPVKADGQSDAETIIKIGPRKDIETEYQHYDAFVKDRLPPLTARIQKTPVAFRGGAQAAIQYTCIAEPGKSPVSLRQALLSNPDPALILQLFNTFGAYWWMQRQPYTFRLGQEYDRLLPPHLVMEPATGPAGRIIMPGDDPETMRLRPGDLVNVAAFEHYDVRADGQSLTLWGDPAPGRPALRARWLGLRLPTGTTARVVALRIDLLRQYTAGFDLLGLPDLLPGLQKRLQTVVAGTRSIIHGDLNLENILVGPGKLVWLIDFAQTREGHPLFDFSHLASELIAHILVEKYPAPREYLDSLRSGGDPLLRVVEDFARECQFDPRDAQEYRQALTLACLGALKYQNLPAQAKYYLYLTAAYYGS